MREELNEIWANVSLISFFRSSKGVSILGDIYVNINLDARQEDAHGFDFVLQIGDSGNRGVQVSEGVLERRRECEVR